MSTGNGAAHSDLYLVGAGVSFPVHLTVQTIEVLSLCNRICTNLPADRLEPLPQDLLRKCQSLWPLYVDDRDRMENYGIVAEAVMDMTQRHRPVAWMTTGHPFVFDSVSQMLLKAGRARGWNVAVVPGISCLDTILAEIGYDPASGLFVHEATSVVKRGLALMPEHATLLLQPSAFGSELAHYSDGWQPDLTPLRDYLLRFYGAAHDCAFVRSSSESAGRSYIYWKKLGELATVPHDALAGSTLFLPAIEKV